MKLQRAIVALLLVYSTIAFAGPRNVMVLRAEGTADATSRSTVESHVLRLAKTTDGKVEMGDITMSDAAAAAGCNAAEPSCKDEILATFAIDELVTTTVTTTSAGGLTVTVRRLQKGSAPKTAASTLPPGRPSQSKIDQDLGPLFGVGLSTGPLTDRTPTHAATTPPPAVTPSADPVPVDPYTSPAAATAPEGAAAATQPTEPQPVDTPAPSRKWQKIGMGVGAGMILLSLILWTGASGKQEEIDSAPHDTPADFQHLRDLEDEADGLAGGGNLFFIAGVALTTVSAYFYWKKGRTTRSTTAARITPTAFPHGAGVVLSWGGGL